MCPSWFFTTKSHKVQSQSCTKFSLCYFVKILCVLRGFFTTRSHKIQSQSCTKFFLCVLREIILCPSWFFYHKVARSTITKLHEVFFVLLREIYFVSFVVSFFYNIILLIPALRLLVLKLTRSPSLEWDSFI